MQNRITFKVLSLFVVLLIIVGVIGSFSINTYNSNYLTQKIEKNKLSITSQLKVILAEPVFVYDKDVIKQTLDSYNDNEFITSLVVVDQRGRLLGKLIKPFSVDDKTNIPISFDSKTVGTIKVGFSNMIIKKEQSRLLTQSFIMIFILLAMVVMVLIPALKLTCLNRIQKVNNVLADIASGGGDLTARIPVTSQDEIGQLGTNFNAFIQTIQEIVSEMGVATASLDASYNRAKSEIRHRNQENEYQRVLAKKSTNSMSRLEITTHDIVSNTKLVLERAQQTISKLDISRKISDENLYNIKQLTAKLEDELGYVITDEEPSLVSKNMIDDTIEKAQKTNASLDEIIADIQSIVDMVVVISRASKEQSCITDLVNDDMATINLCADKMNVRNVEADNIVNQLALIGNKLTEQIHRFQY